MRLSVKSSTSIKVTWERSADCRDWNGEIIGYSVRYGEEGSSDKTVRMDSQTTVFLFLLTKETVYTIEVAAVTSAGTGVYSQPQTIETPDSESFPFTSVYVL